MLIILGIFRCGSIFITDLFPPYSLPHKLLSLLLFDEFLPLNNVSSFWSDMDPYDDFFFGGGRVGEVEGIEMSEVLEVLYLSKVRKTVGAEVNYGIRFKDAEQAAQFVDQLSTEVAGRLNKLDTRGRCITLKLMLRAGTECCYIFLFQLNS